MTTAIDTYNQLREAIRGAVQVRVSLLIPTSTSRQKEAIENYRDGLEIPDLLDDVTRDYHHILNRSTPSERIDELLPRHNPDKERMVYEIEVLEASGQAPIIFRSNFNYSVIEEHTRYITVCTECGSDSIVDSRFGTEDGWCDQCEGEMDQIELSERNYHAKQFDFPLDSDGEPINDNAEGKGLPQYADQELVKREIKEKSNE